MAIQKYDTRGETLFFDPRDSQLPTGTRRFWGAKNDTKTIEKEKKVVKKG